MYAGKGEKLKQIVSTSLYSAFLLAEGGEFFVSHNEKSIENRHETSNGEAIAVKAELPTHLPERLSDERLKISRTCFRPKGYLATLLFSERGDHRGELCIETDRQGLSLSEEQVAP